MSNYFGEHLTEILDISVRTDYQTSYNFILKKSLELSLVPTMDFLGFDSKLLHLSSLLIAPSLCHIIQPLIVFWKDTTGF